MAFVNIFEILDVILMIFVVGFLFMSQFKPMRHSAEKEDILDRYIKKGKKGFDWDALWFAAMVTAPAIILHELGHKIVAMSFGFQSTFHAACSTSSILSGGFFDFYCMLTIIAVVLKIMGVGFLFFIPAFVQTVGNTTHLQNALIALAGPVVNLLIFIGSWIALKRYKFSAKTTYLLTLTKTINLFLFIFNILPIPGFDGFQVFYNLFKVFF